jgi:hypothetical protein
MVKKFNNLSAELSKDIKGFEDIFQEYVDSEEEKDKRRLEKNAAKSTENYELQNFLEEEHNRLTNIEVFYTKKMPAKINFSQTDKLLVEQLKKKNVLLIKLEVEFSKPDSQLQKNLSQMFNSHFG